MRLNVLHPIPHVVERGLVVHRVDQQNAHGSTVVRCDNKTTLVELDSACCRVLMLQGGLHMLQGHHPCCTHEQTLHNRRTARNCSETLLSCRVPYLKLDPLVVKQNLLDLEVNSAPGIRRHSMTSAIHQTSLTSSNINQEQAHRNFLSPDGRDEARGERILREPQEQTTLSNACTLQRKVTDLLWYPCPA